MTHSSASNLGLDANNTKVYQANALPSESCYTDARTDDLTFDDE